MKSLKSLIGRLPIPKNFKIEQGKGIFIIHSKKKNKTLEIKPKDVHGAVKSLMTFAS